jgi:hypothetical protein
MPGRSLIGGRPGQRREVLTWIAGLSLFGLAGVVLKPGARFDLASWRVL